jgi:hypothetical protein
MQCGANYHETPLSTLFGSAITPSTTEIICAPDSQNCGAFSFECAIEQYKDANFVDVAKATAQSAAQLVAFYATGGVSVVSDILKGVGAEQNNPDFLKAGAALGLANSATTLDLDWEATMGLFDDLSFDFSGLGDFASSLVEETDWSAVTDLAQTGLQAYNVANMGGGVQTVPVMAKVPQVIAGAGGAVARAGATVGRSFFNKWPNLAVAIQKMKNAGQNVSRSKLYSMLKRFGPEFLVTAGIMSAAAVSELALAGPGHRRMNPANSKALRRAQRRLKSFHRLCVDTDALRSRGRRKRC